MQNRDGLIDSRLTALRLGLSKKEKELKDMEHNLAVAGRRKGIDEGGRWCKGDKW